MISHHSIGAFASRSFSRLGVLSSQTPTMAAEARDLVAQGAVTPRAAVHPAAGLARTTLATVPLLALVDAHLACEVDADCLVYRNQCVERGYDGYFPIGAATPTEEFEVAIAELNQCAHATDSEAACTGSSLVGRNLEGACIQGTCVARQMDRVPGTDGTSGVGGGGGSSGAPG